MAQNIVGGACNRFTRKGATLRPRMPGNCEARLGAVHGGVLCEIADAAMGAAFASTLDADQSFTTLELKINFLRPVWESMLQAKARVTSRGKTLGLIECDFIDAKGRLIARASSTCLVLSGEDRARSGDGRDGVAAGQNRDGKRADR